MPKNMVKLLLTLVLSVPAAVAAPVYMNFSAESSFSALATVSAPQNWQAPQDTGLRNTSVTIGSQTVYVQLLYWTPNGTPDLTQYAADPNAGSSTTIPASGFRQTYENAANSANPSGVYWYFDEGTNILVPMESATPGDSQPTFLIWRFTFANSSDYSTSVRGFGIELSTPSVGALGGGSGFDAVMNAYAKGSTLSSFTSMEMAGGPSSCAITGACSIDAEAAFYGHSLGFMGIWNQDALKTIDHIDIIGLAPVNGQASLGRFYVDFSGALPPWQPTLPTPESATSVSICVALAAATWFRVRKRS